MLAHLGLRVRYVFIVFLESPPRIRNVTIYPCGAMMAIFFVVHQYVPFFAK